MPRNRHLSPLAFLPAAWGKLPARISRSNNQNKNEGNRSRSTYALNQIHGGVTDQGVSQEDLPPEVSKAFSISVMILAAADGEFSDGERDEFLAMLEGFGVPEAVIAELAEFDPVGKTLSDYLPVAHRGMARHFLYDAIKISMVDGYHEKEQAAIHAAAASIGVSADVVTSIEGLISVENALRDARLALLRGSD